MSKSFTTITNDINGALATFRKDAPETMKNFQSFARNALREGALSELEKELIALAIGVACRCDGCIGFHVKALVRLGVTREQFMETLEVCAYMGGGPSVMYVAEAIRAYEEFSSPNK